MSTHQPGLHDGCQKSQCSTAISTVPRPLRYGSSLGSPSVGAGQARMAELSAPGRFGPVPFGVKERFSEPLGVTVMLSGSNCVRTAVAMFGDLDNVGDWGEREVGVHAAFVHRCVRLEMLFHLLVQKRISAHLPADDRRP